MGSKSCPPLPLHLLRGTLCSTSALDLQMGDGRLQASSDLLLLELLQSPAALLRHPLAFSLSTLKPPSPLPLSLLRLSAFQRPLSAVISPFPLAVVLAALLLLPLPSPSVHLVSCPCSHQQLPDNDFSNMQAANINNHLNHTALSKKQSLKGTYSHSIPTQSCSDEEAETSVISRLTGMVRIGIWQRQAKNLQIFPSPH